ncbi:hypothetical protein DFH06DRAFT_1291260, partial [Mycena polygramma]
VNNRSRLPSSHLLSIAGAVFTSTFHHRYSYILHPCYGRPAYKERRLALTLFTRTRTVTVYPPHLRISTPPRKCTLTSPTNTSCSSTSLDEASVRLSIAIGAPPSTQFLPRCPCPISLKKAVPSPPSLPRRRRTCPSHSLHARR